MSQSKTILVEASVAEIFSPWIKEAAVDTKFFLNDFSHAYVLSVLEKYLFAESLFASKFSEPTVAESLLLALQEEEAHKKQKQLKSLGDSILFKSGFFADSFKRKIIGIGYYIDMGSAAYKNLYESSKNPVYGDLSSRFPGYVDLFSEVGSKMNFKSQEDLIVLFDRYLEGGSEPARSKLIELGAIPAQNKKASNQ